MQHGLAVTLVVATIGLAGCGQNDAERGAVGASIGGVATALTGGSPTQIVAATAAGAAAGALCDDAGLCGQR